MALSEQAIQEAADLLPEGMRYNNDRERLLCVIETLCTLSDSDHPLSNADIANILKCYFDRESFASPNTIADDIKAIDKSGCLGLSILPKKGHRTRGVYVERPALPPRKVRLLLNAVQSSRFLTMSQSADLQEALLDLMSRPQGELLEREVHVKRRARPTDPSVFETCDIIAEAINRGRKVSFTYTYTGFDSKPHPLPDKRGNKTRCETPLGLFFSEGNYYLETYAPDDPYDHGTTTMRSRVDRMRDVSVSAKKADVGAEVREAAQSLTQRFEESFDMVGESFAVVFLRVRADETNVMSDRFGYRLEYRERQGRAGDKASSMLTCVRVAPSFTFYRWLATAGDGIIISEPPAEITLANGWWAKTINGRTREELVADYTAVRDGYLAFLDRARAPYLVPKDDG